MAQAAAEHFTDGLRGVVAGNVLSLMGRNRISQAKLAAALGMSQPSLSKRINGSKSWELDELEKVAAYFGREVTALLVPTSGYNSDDPADSVISDLIVNPRPVQTSLRYERHLTPVP